MDLERGSTSSAFCHVVEVYQQSCYSLVSTRCVSIEKSGMIRLPGAGCFFPQYWTCCIKRTRSAFPTSGSDIATTEVGSVGSGIIYGIARHRPGSGGSYLMPVEEVSHLIPHDLVVAC
eukprot:1805886-Rhodomonas_salina.2